MSYWPFDDRACRVCGCTEDKACVGGCWWVEYDLCSACANKRRGIALWVAIACWAVIFAGLVCAAWLLGRHDG